MPKYKFLSPKQFFRSLNTQWQNTKKPWVFIEFFAVACIVSWLISGSISSWKWLTTQLDLDEIYFAGKSLWEWTELLIVPLLLLLCSIAIQQALKGRDIERTRQEMLKNYLNQMTELLLNPAWPKGDDQAQSAVTAVAYAKTLAVLRDLDGEQKGVLIRFLIESKALPFISLYNADLEKANLIGANLEKANLSYACLDFSYLNGIDFRSATLIGTRFLNAHFLPAKANFSYEPANSSPSEDCEGIFWPANLSFADCRDANLRGSNLERAVLERTKLYNANLQGANLTDSILRRA